MAAIILAGGLSTRMRRDKVSLVLGDSTLLGSLVTRFSGEFGPVIVVARPGQSLAVGDAIAVRDIFTDCGPLGGIHAGLVASPDDMNLVIACDMPFADPAVARYLASLCGDHDIAVALLDRGPEPLFAVYRKSVLPQIEANLGTHSLKLRSLLDAVDTLYVPQGDLVEIDPLLRCFVNVNTPQDWDESAPPT